MDYEALKITIDVIQFIVVGAVGVVAWYANRTRATRRELQDMDRRLTAVETRAESAPTRDSLHKLSLVVAEIEGDIKGLCARFDGVGEVLKRIESAVNRHEDHLLNRGGK